MPAAKQVSEKEAEELRKAKLENDKTEKELEEWQSPAARAQREAERKKAAAHADRRRRKQMRRRSRPTYPTSQKQSVAPSNRRAKAASLVQS